jgi:branched-chain amino acid transport system substrate-binding protein
MKNSIKILSGIIILALIVIAFNVFSSITGNTVKEDNTIKIGVLAPLTGDLSTMGERMRNGMDMARDDILKNDSSENIEIIYEDVSCDAKQSISALNKLISVDNIRIIGGSFCLVSYVPTIPITEKTKVISFNTAANPDVVLNNKYVFSTNVAIKDDSEKLTDFATNDLKANTAAIVYLETPFGKDYDKYITKDFSDKGGKITGHYAKPFDAKDFRTELTKIKGENPDVIFIIHFSDSLGLFLRESKELGINSKILGYYEGDDPAALNIAKDAAEGFIISSSDPTIDSEKIKDFEKRYEEKYKAKPDVVAANSYDALMLQVETYKKCNGNTDCIALELHKVKDYSGVSGEITINPDGSTTKPTIFKIVKNGGFVKYEE